MLAHAVCRAQNREGASGLALLCARAEMVGECITCDEPHIKSPPIGANRRPIMKRVGRTVLGVRIGCHAFRRCCLNAVSV